MITTYSWLDQYKTIVINTIPEYFGIEVEIISKYEALRLTSGINQTLAITSGINQTLAITSGIDQTLALNSKMDLETAS
jgi:hypothetical protein